MERVKDYEEERVKEVKGKGAKDFKDCYVLSARRSIPGSIYGIVTYKVPSRVGQ